MPEPAKQVRRDSPDPGSRQMGVIGLIAAISLVLVVMVFQQFGESAASKATHANAAAVEPPSVADPVRMASSIMVRMQDFIKTAGAQGGGPTPGSFGDPMGQIESGAVTTVDKFRVAIVAAELVSDASAEQRLAKLDADVAAGKAEQFEGYEEDKATFERVLAGEADALPMAERERFVERHGYFGELALSKGKPATDAMREKVAGGGAKLVAIFVVIGLVVVFAFFAAITCFIIACVKLGQRGLQRRFLPPMPGGSVFIELVAFFAGGFIVYKLAGDVLSGLFTNTQTYLLVVLLLQWVLALIVFYPLLRGVSFAELRRRIGWTSGQGVWKEIGAGIFGYFAFLPIFFLAVVVAWLLMALWTLIRGGDAGPAPSTAVGDLIGGASGITIIVLFSLVTIWAPLVEESVMRGALYRHLRSRVGMFLAAAISAACFGLMHGYPFLLLLPVTMLGFGFALMREWRGSLIAPIVAHFMHNATVFTILLLLFSVL
jgi:membrane protease YdiL (CAAX protease family)